MIRLIASDMDGTLLGNKMEVLPENIEAIRYAEKQGIRFMVATGRGITEALPPLQDAGITCPLITVNGAEAYDKDGNELFSIAIPTSLAKQIIDELTQAGLYFELATNQGIFTNNAAMRLENTAEMLANKLPHLTFKMAVSMAAAHLEFLHIEVVEDYQQLLDDAKIEVLKFLVFSQKDSQILTEMRQKIETLPDVVVTSSFANNIEINHANAQKGVAVKHMADKLGIPMSEVMTIGDNFNDVSMLELAGVSFAMGNAEPGVKAVAKYETASHLDAGVGKAIMRAINENL